VGDIHKFLARVRSTALFNPLRDIFHFGNPAMPPPYRRRHMHIPDPAAVAQEQAIVDTEQHHLDAEHREVEAEHHEVQQERNELMQERRALERQRRDMKYKHMTSAPFSHDTGAMVATIGLPSSAPARASFSLWSVLTACLLALFAIMFL
jgi:hypothetical protein